MQSTFFSGFTAQRAVHAVLQLALADNADEEKTKKKPKLKCSDAQEVFCER